VHLSKRSDDMQLSVENNGRRFSALVETTWIVIQSYNLSRTYCLQRSLLLIYLETEKNIWLA